METPTIKARKTKWVLDPAHSEISFKVKTSDDHQCEGRIQKIQCRRYNNRR
jgi:polyisoprenoid-binding protein YceI